MNISAYADKNGEIYITVPTMPSATQEAGFVSSMGSMTISLSHLLRKIVREELERAKQVP